MGMPKKKIAIIAAMEREIKPLVRGWSVRTIEHGGRRYRLFENGDAALVCGGIGATAARCATEALIQEVSPWRVISVGFAGALNGSLQVGRVVWPRIVINAADGVRIDVGFGEGILVTSSNVADQEQKSRLAKAYGASAVDMEAGAVAQGARARGIEFAALKVISDDADSSLRPIDRFVGDDGSFRSTSFVGYVALRPWLWGTTLTLARNSSKASHALCSALASYLSDENFAHRTFSRESLSREALSGESLVGGLNPTKVSSQFAGAHTCIDSQAHTEATQK
jgi:nucleoside phosphorylase